MVRIIAAYNAGEKAVDKYQGTPYQETQIYVRRVLHFAGMRLHGLSRDGLLLDVTKI